MQTVEDFDQQRESPVKEKKRDYPHINDTPGVGYRSKGSNFVIGMVLQLITLSQQYQTMII